jgi:hypothetical protein
VSSPGSAFVTDDHSQAAVKHAISAYGRAAVASRLAASGRRLRLRLAERWPWTGELTAAVAHLQAIPSG